MTPNFGVRMTGLCGYLILTGNSHKESSGISGCHKGFLEDLAVMTSQIASRARAAFNFEETSRIDCRIVSTHFDALDDIGRLFFSRVPTARLEPGLRQRHHNVGQPLYAASSYHRTRHIPPPVHVPQWWSPFQSSRPSSLRKPFLALSAFFEACQLVWPQLAASTMVS